MRKIGFIRHAAYHSPEIDGGIVGKIGRIEANFLAQSLKKKFAQLNSCDVKIISSPAGRALGTAEIIAQKLDAGNVETYNCLWSDREHKEDFDAIDEVLEKEFDSEKVLLVVSHAEVVDEFTEEFLKRNGFIDAAMAYDGLRTAECAFVDLDEHTFQIIL